MDFFNFPHKNNSFLVYKILSSGNIYEGLVLYEKEFQSKINNI